MKNIPTLYIVVPCYNEERVLPLMMPVFLEKLDGLKRRGFISENSCVLFVDDGSLDGTWRIICESSERFPIICGLSFSRNCGHQNALMAGLIEASDRCDICVSIDCDGQDSIDAIDAMVEKYMDGCEVVYGVRDDRTTDSVFKRWTAERFYGLMRFLGCDIVSNHADYRLMSNRVLKCLSGFDERNLFLRGLIPLVGFKSDIVYYSRKERQAGQSHYPLSKMLQFALDGVFGMSIKPVRFIAVLAAGTVLCSFVAGFFCGLLAFMVLFCSGLQLLAIGCIGEYVGRVLAEVRHRPRYIIADKTGDIFHKQGGL